MSRLITTDAEISQLLRSVRTIAIVGLSERSTRPAFRVAKYLQEVGYEVIPINPHRDSWQGITSYADVQSVGRDVDLVDVFRRPDFVLETMDDAITAGAGAVWTQLGVVNDEATERALQAGMPVVVDRCTAIEHRRLIGARERVQ